MCPRAALPQSAQRNCGTRVDLGKPIRPPIRLLGLGGNGLRQQPVSAASLVSEWGTHILPLPMRPSRSRATSLRCCKKCSPALWCTQRADADERTRRTRALHGSRIGWGPSWRDAHSGRGSSNPAHLFLCRGSSSLSVLRKQVVDQSLARVVAYGHRASGQPERHCRAAFAVKRPNVGILGSPRLCNLVE